MTEGLYLVSLIGDGSRIFLEFMSPPSAEHNDTVSLILSFCKLRPKLFREGTGSNSSVVARDHLHLGPSWNPFIFQTE